jgi:hypothetical protein
MKKPPDGLVPHLDRAHLSGRHFRWNISLCAGSIQGENCPIFSILVARQPRARAAAALTGSTNRRRFANPRMRSGQPRRSGNFQHDGGLRGALLGGAELVELVELGR